MKISTLPLLVTFLKEFSLLANYGCKQFSFRHIITQDIVPDFYKIT